MGYDYTGYGCSAGDAPSVGHTLSDVTAVYEYLVNVRHPIALRIRSLGEAWHGVFTCYEINVNPHGACPLKTAGHEAPSQEHHLVWPECGDRSNGG